MTDWEILKRLRTRFLTGDAVEGPDYWTSNADLEAYDATFAQRIDWKWQAVLGEAQRGGWAPDAPGLFDWGCGTGIATRRMLETWGARWKEISLWDRSARARAFARGRVLDISPGTTITTESGGEPPSGDYTMLLSHVLGELDETSVERLLPLLRSAASVLWVEPGAPALSRRLIAIRERVRADFDLLAPCPHQQTCGLLASGNEAHWCHHFAPPPSEIFQSERWRKFGEMMKIDLRSLPTSFLILRRKAARAPAEGARILGRPRIYKGYATALVCERSGVHEHKWLKREDKELFKRLEKGGWDSRTRPED